MSTTIEKPASGGALKSEIKQLKEQLAAVTAERDALINTCADTAAQRDGLYKVIQDATFPPPGMTHDQALRTATEPKLEVWSRIGDTKTIKGSGLPYRWRYHNAGEDEWIYHERLAFPFDSGYGAFVMERAAAMVGNAFGGVPKPDGTGVSVPVQIQRLGSLDKAGNQTFEKLPKFDPWNVIEVVVRIRKGTKPVDPAG